VQSGILFLQHLPSIGRYRSKEIRAHLRLGTLGSRSRSVRWTLQSYQIKFDNDLMLLSEADFAKGTVDMLWAFRGSPTENISITCHVLPYYTYEMIIGKEFLATTETIPKHMDRLTQCSFGRGDNVHINFLENGLDLLLGKHVARQQLFLVPGQKAMSWTWSKRTFLISSNSILLLIDGRGYN